MKGIMDKEHYITNPKPIYTENNFKRGSKRFKMGTRGTGIVLDINKKGVEINGYYNGINGRNTVFSIFHKPIFIPWDEFDKMRSIPKRKSTPVDVILDQKYFDTLPIIELNDRKFYIDSGRQERREVSNPHKIVKF